MIQGSNSYFGYGINHVEKGISPVYTHNSQQKSITTFNGNYFVSIPWSTKKKLINDS